jgi:hypothetical protein
METESALTQLQEPATGSFLGPDESRPHPNNLFVLVTF